MSIESPSDFFAWMLAFAGGVMLATLALGLAGWVFLELREQRVQQQEVFIPKARPFRWGGLSLRRRPGADVVELHSRERGNVA